MDITLNGVEYRIKRGDEDAGYVKGWERQQVREQVHGPVAPGKQRLKSRDELEPF